ncbi:unnamed protein product, partial [Mesorhabditis spiculigera]
MVRVSPSHKTVILHYHRHRGLGARAIESEFKRARPPIQINLSQIKKVLLTFKKNRHLGRKQGSGRPRRLTDVVKQDIADLIISDDDEPVRSKSPRLGSRIGSWQASPLHFPTAGNVDGPLYRQLIRTHALPEIGRLYPNGDAVFVQDWAPAHGARDTLALFANRNLDFLDRATYPPKSPDLNVLDYRIWACMQDRVSADKPTTLPDLERSILHHWNSLPLALVQRWIQQFRPRVQKTIDCDGGHIQTFFNKN